MLILSHLGKDVKVSKIALFVANLAAKILHAKNPEASGRPRDFDFKILRAYFSIASIVPAATAVPMTPETFGPMACIRR